MLKACSDVPMVSHDWKRKSSAAILAAEIAPQNAEGGSFLPVVTARMLLRWSEQGGSAARVEVACVQVVAGGRSEPGPAPQERRSHDRQLAAPPHHRAEQRSGACDLGSARALLHAGSSPSTPEPCDPRQTRMRPPKRAGVFRNAHLQREGPRPRECAPIGHPSFELCRRDSRILGTRCVREPGEGTRFEGWGSEVARRRSTPGCAINACDAE